MSFGKPLMSPRPRRRNREAGARSERLREAIRQPAGPRRTGPAKRRSLGRLLGRYEPEPRPVAFVALVALGLVALAVLVAREFIGSATPVDYGRQSEAYGRLADAFADACPDDPCGFGWSSQDRPSADVQALMSRLRVRRAGHDPISGTSWLSGTHRSRFDLVHRAPRSGESAASRAAAERALAERYRGPAAEPAWVGAGWLRVDR